MAENDNLIVDVKVNTGNTTSELNKVSKGVKDLEQNVASTATTADKLRDTLNFGNAVIGAIASVKGAMIGLGIENKNVLNSLTQLMALQQVYEGSMRVINFLTSESIILTKTKTALQWLYNTALKATATTMAMVTGGLTLLIAGITTAIILLKQKKDANNALVSSYREELDVLNKANEANNTRNNLLITGAEREIKIAKARGESIQKIFELEQNLLRLQFESERQRARQLQNEIEGLRKLFWLEKDREERQKIVDQMNEKRAQRDEAIKNAEEAFFNGQIARLTKRTEDTKKQYEEDVKNYEDAEQKKLEATKKRIEEEKRLTNERNEWLAQIRDAEYEFLTNDLQKQLDKTIEHYMALIWEANKYGVDTTVLETALKTELDKINTEFNNKQIADNKAKEDKINADKQKAWQQQQQLNNAKLQAEQMLVSGIIDLAQSMGEENERALRFSKQMALFQILVDTAVGISKATALTVAGNPLTMLTRFGMVMGVILGNMAKARAILNSVNVGGGTATDMGATRTMGVSSYGAGGIQTPPPPSGEGGTGERSTDNTGQSSAMRVYVTETDITRTQTQVAFINKVATI